jgi:hypothetical protein
VLQAGVLKPLLNFITGENRDVQRFGIMCLKELCENKENRGDLFEQTPAQPMLDAVFQLANNSDPRVRLMAGLTLVALLGESNNKLIMLDAGSLPRMLVFLRSRDPQLRRLAVDCIVHITKLQDIHPLPIAHCHIVRADDVLATIVEAFGSETDPGLLLGLLKSIQSLVLVVKQDAKRMKQRLYEFGLSMMLLDQAKRLVCTDQQTAETLELVDRIVRMLSSLTSRSKPRLESIYETGHERTVVLLCKSSDKKVRRGAVRLLGRLSTLVMWKEGIVSDTDVLPLLLSMCKVNDPTVQVTAAQILAEIAELPATRVVMIQTGVLPVLLNLLRLDDSRVHRDVMRTMAALAESVENRETMSYRALESILSMLWKEDQVTQAASVRALANLAAPAGVISKSAESLVQEQNATANVGSSAHADGIDSGDQTQTLEVKLRAQRPTFELVGRFGSSFVAPEDYEDEVQLQPRLPLPESLPSFEAMRHAQQETESHARSGDDDDGTEGGGNDDNDDASSTCSSVSSAVSSSESVKVCAAELVVAAADDARARAATAVIAGRKERMPIGVTNDPSWWGTEEGNELMYTFNHSTLDRIHLKLVEMPTFTDLFNPDLPCACCDLPSTAQLWSLSSRLLTLMHVVVLICSIRELSTAGVHASADLIRFLGRSIPLPAVPDAAVHAPASMAAAKDVYPEPEEATASSAEEAEDTADLH